MKKLTLLLVLCLAHLIGVSQAIRLQENFNAAVLPTGWANTAVSGTQTWSFGINGSVTQTGNNNLDGTAMAFFDDDNLGASSTNNTVTLTSPTFDNSNDSATFLEFDYNFREFAGPADRFYVEVYDGTSWNTVFSRLADDCGNWLGGCAGNFPHANIDISAHKNVNCQVRFTYHDGNDWCWYVGIDNVRVTSSVNNDLEVASIETPKNSCSLGSAESVQVLLKNPGGNNITSPFTVTIDVDNGIQTITDTVNSTINVGDSLLYTFNSTLNLSNKAVYALKAYSSFSLDFIYANDTATASVENITALNIPFIEDFESVSSNWIISGQNSSWQIGTPNGTVLDSAYRGTGSAVTNLSGNYNNSETSYLETACISTSQPNRVPVLSFYLNYFSEPNFDELILESSIDNGATWQKVNAGGLSSNWYTNNSSWNGLSNGWIRVENTLDSLVSHSDFKLRLAFTSDGSGNREGFAIDNFELRYQDSTDVKIDVISYPVTSSQVCGLGTEFIKVQLTNIGQLSIDSTYLSYRVNGGTAVTDLLDSNIAALQTINYTFSTPYNFSAAATYSVDVWLSTANDNNFGNDSILNHQVVNTVQSNSIDTLPFYENFDGPPWSPSIPGVPIPNGIDSNWSRFPSQINSINTWLVSNNAIGPFVAFNGNGQYLYYETSGAAMGSNALLTTPCIRIPFNSSAVLQFFSHGYPTQASDLTIEINYGNGWMIDTVFSNHTQTNINSPWTKRTISLSKYNGRTIKVRFKTTAPGSFQGDVAIDEIHIFDPLTTTASKNQIPENILQLYPNPNNGNFNLNVSNELVDKQYQVFDVKGGIVKQGRINTANSRLELSNAEKGVYFLRIEGQAKAERIVVL